VKITSNLDPQTIADVYTRLQEKKAKQTEQNKARHVEQTDKIEISAKARELQVYQARLKELSDARTELVDSIKKQLQKDTYRPQAEKIAAGIVEEYRLDKKAAK